MLGLTDTTVHERHGTRDVRLVYSQGVAAVVTSASPAGLNVVPDVDSFCLNVGACWDVVWLSEYG